LRCRGCPGGEDSQRHEFKSQVVATIAKYSPFLPVPRTPVRRSTHLEGRREGRLEGQASHLVRFLVTGGDSPAVRAELRTIETTLEGLRAEWTTIEKASALPPPRVHPAWVMTKLERLDALLRRDPQRAKLEILKHLDGDLVIMPRPSITGERRAEISGRAKSDSLLRDQEAVCLQVVAGARNHRYQRCSVLRSI
jgi:hypothetical protein